MASFSFGGGKRRGFREVEVPEWLAPFVGDAATFGRDVLRDFRSMHGTDQVANLTPEQQQGLQGILSRMQGAGGFIPQFEQELLRTSGGRSATNMLPESVVRALSGGSGRLDALTGQLMSTGNTLDRDILGRLARFNPMQGQDALQRIIGEGSLPGSVGQALEQVLNTARAPGTVGQSMTALRNLLDDSTVSRIPGIATDALEGLITSAGETAIPASATEALEATARGDFLAGGEGFDTAVDAAVRAALPQIRSVFGSAGAGGFDSGLAQTAVGQAATDAFARQFGAERGRQVGAADALARLGITEAGRRSGDQLSAASALADQQLRERGLLSGNTLASARSLDDLQQRDISRRQGETLSAADILGSQNLSDAGLRINALGQLEAADVTRRGQSADAARALADIDLSRSQLAGGLLEGSANRALSGGGLLTNLINAERNRQEAATRDLPGAAAAGPEGIFNVGSILQDQEQRELTGRQEFNEMLLRLALGVFDPSEALGEFQQTRDRGFGFSFGG